MKKILKDCNKILKDCNKILFSLNNIIYNIIYFGLKNRLCLTIPTLIKIHLLLFKKVS